MLGLRPATLLKKRLLHRCFPVNFAKFSRTPLYRAPLDDCFHHFSNSSLLSSKKYQLIFFLISQTSTFGWHRGSLIFVKGIVFNLCHSDIQNKMTIIQITIIFDAFYQIIKECRGKQWLFHEYTLFYKQHFFFQYSLNSWNS